AEAASPIPKTRKSASPSFMIRIRVWNPYSRRSSLEPELVELVAPGLQGAADFADHGRLRQPDAALVRHREHDFHVVLGPCHRLPAPVFQRAVRRAAAEESLAQRLDVHPVA